MFPTQVNHREFLSPDFLERVMEFGPQVQAVYEARGTASYETLLMELPENWRDKYHVILQYMAQYTITLLLAQRSVESIFLMEVSDLVRVEDELLTFSYWVEAERGSSKNHFADIESCAEGGVIPDLNMTRGKYIYNLTRTIENYFAIRDPEGDKRLLMRPRRSVNYSEYGCRLLARSSTFTILWRRSVSSTDSWEAYCW